MNGRKANDVERESRRSVRQQVGAWLRGVNYRERLARYLGAATMGTRWNRGAELLTELPGTRVLVLAPHMDDETVGCGGTIRKMASAGKEVTVLFMTDGRRGDAQIAHATGHERAALEAALMAARKEEARRACGILGVSAHVFLDEEDARLRSTASVRQAVSDVLDRVRPDVVMTPFFTDEHEDHKATAKILLEVLAARRATCLCLAYEVWTPLFPNVLVDISDSAAVKREALQVYRSQLKDNDLVAGVFGLNAYRHMALGGQGLAEAFWMGGAPEYCALYRRHLGVQRAHDDSAHS